MSLEPVFVHGVQKNVNAWAEKMKEKRGKIKVRASSIKILTEADAFHLWPAPC
jgi:hypothetical protein